MDIKSLQEFVVLSKHMHFAKAAQELNFSLSALSSHVAALEREVGARLINRGEGKASLTPEGKRFLAGAYAILDTYENTLKDIETLATKPSPVRIYCQTPNIEIRLLAKEVIKEKTVFLAPDPSASALDQLIQDACDIALTVNIFADEENRKKAQANGIAYFTFKPEYGQFVVGKNHPLAVHADNLTSEHLKKALVSVVSGEIPDAAKAFRVNFSSSFGVEENDFEIRFEPFSDSIDFLSDFKGDSVFLTSQAPYITTLLATRDDLVMIDSINGLPITFELVVAYKVNHNPSVEKALEALRSYAADEKANCNAN